MRPDLLGLRIDSDRKDLVTEDNKNGKNIAIRTIDRIGLSTPLPIVKSAENEV